MKKKRFTEEQIVRMLWTTVSGGGTESDGRMFVFGNYLDEVLVMGYRFSTSWIDFYYGHDHLYSPTVLYGSTGIAVERYEYDAYGSVQILTSAFYPLASSQYGNPYTFTGRELDTMDNNTLRADVLPRPHLRPPNRQVYAEGSAGHQPRRQEH
jgi:hypothetical protein